MASIFKRGRWVDGNGSKVSKGTPGARWQESRFWCIKMQVSGRPKTVKGYSDKGATIQLAAKLERDLAQGEQGLVDPYRQHRHRPLGEHVADWIAELRQLQRSPVYIRLCESRLERLLSECSWVKISDITAESFIDWRDTALATVGHARKAGSNVVPMSARTKNHHAETLRSFCRWAVKRKRIGALAFDVEGLETAGQLRRQRRALSAEEIADLLAVVPARHQLAYRLILNSGLRRNEVRQLVWGDVKLNAPLPCIQLRAETTKAKRADVLPLRSDLAGLLRDARGDAGDGERVCPTLPSMDSHKRYLQWAGIAYEDERGRRADFHGLRHTYGTMLAQAGVAPRVAMSLMRHTDIRLTMNTYSDPKIFNLAGAVEKLPELPSAQKNLQTVVFTGTDPQPVSVGRTKSATALPAGLGRCLAVSGQVDDTADMSVNPCNGGNRHEKTPSGRGGQKQRVKGIEPSTSSLESSCSAN